MSGFWPNHLGEGWRDGPGQRPQQWHRPRRRSLQGFPISLRIGRDGRKRLGEEEDRLRNPFFLLRQASSWSRSILVRRRRHFCRRPRRGTASSSSGTCWLNKGGREEGNNEMREEKLRVEQSTGEPERVARRKAAATRLNKRTPREITAEIVARPLMAGLGLAWLLLSSGTIQVWQSTLHSSTGRSQPLRVILQTWLLDGHRALTDFSRLTPQRKLVCLFHC